MNGVYPNVSKIMNKNESLKGRAIVNLRIIVFIITTIEFVLAKSSVFAQNSCRRQNP